MTVQAQLKRIDNSRFMARADNGPAYVIDSGDEASGTNPMQMLLMGIAGCTSIDVSNILLKKRIQLAEFEVNIVAEEALKQTIELPETRYCCALATVNAEIESSYKVVSTNE